MKRRAPSRKRHTKVRAPREKKLSASPARSPVQDHRPSLGLQATVERVVPHEWTLAHFDPRLPAVFSTPAMIGMMEHAAAQAVLPDLPAGAITVGTRIEVDHLKALTAGATVRATARLVEQRGRFLVFEVEASAGDIVIGRGYVYRAIVQPEEFHTKARSRAS
ncbi:MAG TPA: hotdog domain-containing protein [Candidatus Sulfotelmatobacter sp.]|nr:hotdog domain-containing protein [Candidatus Sulfotelmatobacter sp.]